MKKKPDLNIAVDARLLTLLRTGIGQYLFHLYQAIEQRDDKPEIHYFSGSRFSSHFPDHPAGSPNEAHISFKEKIAKFLDHFGTTLSMAKRQVNRSIFTYKFNKQIGKLGPDLVHYPDSFCNGNTINVPEIITVYDISCFRLPETHPVSRVKLYNNLLPGSLERAQHIITISEFSKREISDYFGTAPEKITVTYCGVSKAFQPVEESELTETMVKYGLKYKRYFLYTGTIEPRKNLEILLDAFQKLPPAVRANYQLVITGILGWNFEKFLVKAGSLLKKEQLIMPGYVPDHDVPKLMSGAFCFLYPSIYEGFGMPPLEAMACGSPVIISNRTSLPEVAGDSGILLSPDDVDGWSRSIERLLDDRSLYENLKNKGFNRAAQFTWEKCAEETLECFQNNIS